MKIGNLEIKGYAALAPMAGVADRAMREICREHGSAFSVGELTSSKGISCGDKKSQTLLFCGEKERPMASQLFGREPETMANAAREALKFNPDFIDINMGCPAPKVSGNGGGSALLKDLHLAEKIVKAVVESVDVPVTVKMRTGWDEESLVSDELARLCESAGAKAVTIHGRTKKQMYVEGIDFKMIEKTVKAVNIPVIANGDITDGKSAKYMYEATGCDFVMVGRAARGNPFIFEEINAYMENKSYTLPGLEKRFSTLMEQVKRMVNYKQDRRAFLEARKHTAWYMQGLKGAAELRRLSGTVNSFKDIESVCQKALELNRDIW